MATAEEEREIQEKLQATEQTPNPGDVQRTEEVVASEENDNFDTDETLVFPYEDQGDYPAQVVFTVLKDQPVELGGIFGNLAALVSRKEKFDERGEKVPDNPKEIAEQEISDYVMSLASERWRVNPPLQKDEYLVRAIFEELYPGRGRDETVHKSTPNTSWKGVNYDSSGRAQSIHASSNTWK